MPDWFGVTQPPCPSLGLRYDLWIPIRIVLLILEGAVFGEIEVHWDVTVRLVMDLFPLLQMHGQVEPKHGAVSILDKHFHAARLVLMRGGAEQHLLNLSVGEAALRRDASYDFGDPPPFLGILKVVAPVDELDNFAYDPHLR